MIKQQDKLKSSTKKDDSSPLSILIEQLSKGQTKGEITTEQLVQKTNVSLSNLNKSSTTLPSPLSPFSPQSNVTNNNLQRNKSIKVIKSKSILKHKRDESLEVHPILNEMQLENDLLKMISTITKTEEFKREEFSEDEKLRRFCKLLDDMEGLKLKLIETERLFELYQEYQKEKLILFRWPSLVPPSPPPKEYLEKYADDSDGDMPQTPRSSKAASVKDFFVKTLGMKMKTIESTAIPEEPYNASREFNVKTPNIQIQQPSKISLEKQISEPKLTLDTSMAIRQVQASLRKIDSFSSVKSKNTTNELVKEDIINTYLETDKPPPPIQSPTVTSPVLSSPPPLPTAPKPSPQKVLSELAGKNNLLKTNFQSKEVTPAPVPAPRYHYQPKREENKPEMVPRRVEQKPAPELPPELLKRKPTLKQLNK